MKKTMTLAPGAVIETVGDDVMVMMPGNTDVLRISGPAADTLRTIVAGQPVDPSTPTVLELADQGIVSPTGMSRRSLIKAGAVGAGACIAVMAMPTAAMASSSGPSPFVGTGTYRFSTRWDFTITKADFPSVNRYSGLTIGSTVATGGAFSTTVTWNSFDGPYTGDVVGTFEDADTGDVYTVTFSPVP
jgi:hypothetical protein